MGGMKQSFRLSYGDCDVLGIAYFSMFYPWMERVYTNWLFENGVKSGELTEQFGITTVGVHSEASYLAPVGVHDELTVEVVRDRIGESSYTLAYEFRRDGELVTVGKMTFVCRTLENAKTPIPAPLRELINGLPELASS